jgi:hypothetical protein
MYAVENVWKTHEVLPSFDEIFVSFEGQQTKVQVIDTSDVLQ